MNRRRFLAVFALAVVLGGGIVAFGLRRSFRQLIDHETSDLLAAAQPPALAIVRESDLTGLPTPVRRWLRASGVVGTQIPAVVRLTQEGEFRLGPDKPWMPYRATQHYTTNPPGFLWDVSMRMYSVVEVNGRDRYADGVGAIEMRIASIVPVANASGGDLNSGALLRYLNETMWFPAALVLPNIAWEPIDEARARATLTDAGQSVSAVFHFDDQDRLVDMTAVRWNDAEELFLPWSTPLSDWGEFEGIAVPIAGTGRWRDDADAYDYIRLRVTDVAYSVE